MPAVKTKPRKRAKRKARVVVKAPKVPKPKKRLKQFKQKKWSIYNFGQTQSIPCKGGHIEFTRNQHLVTEDRAIAKLARSLPHIEVTEVKE